MSQNNRAAFLTKMFLIGGVVAFALIDVVIFVYFHRNAGRFLSFGPLDVYVLCFVASMPLFVGIRGYFLVTNLMLTSNESDMKTLKTISHLFSFGIIAAYGPLVFVMALLLNLRP
jgi:hypothetical protein